MNEKKTSGASFCLSKLQVVRGMGVALLASASVFASAQESQNLELLTLQDYLQRVLDQNERLQISVLQTEVSEQRLRGAKSIFNPDLVLNYQYEDRDRPNTVQQARALANLTEFDQENHISSSAIESLIPGGGRVRVGYSLSRLRNNLQGAPSLFGGPGIPGSEYVSFAGVSLTQPLLKNAWGASMTQIRLAAQDSLLAYQDYRRELMRVISQAETLYWDLYYAQQQTEFLQESVAVTQNLLNDTKVQETVGAASELEILEIESVLAQRQTQLQDARQAVTENANRLLSLSYGDANRFEDRLLVATDRPELKDVSAYSFFESWQEAEGKNPDLLAQRVNAVRQRIRLYYAKNQKMPNLDLTADYGLNGLGSTPGASMNDIERGNFVGWSVGLEFRVPLLFNGQAKREYEAVKLEVKQADMTLKALQNEVSNGLKTALSSVQNTHSSVGNHAKVVGFYENLLKTQLQRFDVGTVDNQQVLETEEDLLEARTQALLARVLFRRACLQLEILSGTLLGDRGVDLSREELGDKTRQLLRSSGMGEAEFQSFRDSLRQNLRYGGSGENASN